MLAMTLLFLVFALLVAGILAGLFLERRADTDSARLSLDLPRKDRRLTIREKA